MNAIVVAMCLGIASLKTTVAKTCPYNVSACSCTGDRVACFHLQDIPPLTTGSNVTSVTEVIFDTGNITNVRTGSLPPGLAKLEFTGHPLTNISDDAFENSVATLNALSITKSNLRNLPGVLRSLTNLTTLTIINTHIDAWDTGILQHLAKTLTSLQLQNVGLQEWPTWFSYFHSLTTADLSQNPFGSNPGDTFNYSSNTLLYLKLEQCNFTQLPEALSSLVSLTSLSISGNNISDEEVDELAWFPFVRIIEHLFLESMELTRVPDLSNMTSLQELFLSSNQIAHLISYVIPQSVTRLDLESNSLTSVPDDIDDLSSLISLNLAFNEITAVNFHMFPRHLTYLDLRQNKIFNITDKLSTDPLMLQTLYLSHNPLTEITHSAFANLAWLQQLDLQFTSLTELPLALSSLGQLTTLQMSNISSLSCDFPPPEDLVKWVHKLSFGAGVIYGECNNGVSIYDYLTTSPPTRRPITQRMPSSSSGGTQELTTQGNNTGTDGASAGLKAYLLYTYICLLFLFPASYYYN